MAPRFIAFGIFCHASYVYTTKKQRVITITHKYITVQKGFSYFMVVDDNGNHYKVNNSLWYWKWDANEKWSKLRPGDNVYCSSYGMRMQMLGVFPNILSVDYTF
jgi:hypothetical protein